MGIFNNNSYSNTVEVPVLEGYGFEQNGEMRIVREGYQDQLEVIKAIHSLDMADMGARKAVKEGASTYDAEVVLEGAMSNAWTKIKEFFQKLMTKLKSYFAALVRMFDAMTKSTKAFVTKYEAKLKALKNLSGFKYNMFEYENEKIDNDKTADVFANVNAYIESLGSGVNVDDKEDIIDTIRGKIIGSSKVSLDDFNEELFGYFRKGAKNEGDKEDLDVSIFNIISIVKASKAASISQKAESAVVKEFNKKIKEIEGFEKEKVTAVGKSSSEQRGGLEEALKIEQAKLSVYNEAKNEALKFYRAWASVIKERDSVYKSICLKAFSYKKKD